MTVADEYDIPFYTKRDDDITCPLCLVSPHNCVLLQCSSYEKGCRPFVCDTDYLHSNCLGLFKEANSMSEENPYMLTPKNDAKLACPLCRGDVNGWIAIDKARSHFDVKHRRCEVERCLFSGTCLELQKHARLSHPHVRPCKIDSARQLDWDNFQQSTEIIDVLTMIHSEIPKVVVLGDYAIEYGNDSNSGDDFRGNKRNWISSCIFFYKLFRGFRRYRNKRRQSMSHGSPDEGSVSSSGFAEYGDDEIDGGISSATGYSRGRDGPQRQDRIDRFQLKNRKPVGIPVRFQSNLSFS